MPGETITEREVLARVRLARSLGIGALTYRGLLNRFGSAVDAVAALSEGAAAKSRRRIKLAAPRDIETEVEAATKTGARLITWPSDAYPQALGAIADPPPVFMALGPLEISRRCIAIVGARNASLPGRRLAAHLAQELGQADITIVSGLARGIDGAAHAAALGTGTAAVLAGGVNQIYPPEHRNLYRQICEKGTVISEMPLGHVGRAKDFPRRNRIVSGLSLGVIVVEAAERSGTLITARMALEQGREVFAVPGSPLDPRAEGTNRLIRQGAILVRNAEDVIDGLEGTMNDVSDPDRDWSHDAPPIDLSEDERTQLKERVLSLLTTTPSHRDELARELVVSPGHLADVLLDLVLSGYAEEVPGGGFIRS